MLKLTPSEEEAAYNSIVSALRHATLPPNMRILFANPKGGAGKTTGALTLASAIAAVRSMPVAAVEVSDSAGSLARRAEGSPRRGLAELIAMYREDINGSEITGHLTPQSSGAHVLGSQGQRATLTRLDVNRLLEMIAKQYQVTVLDSGNNLYSGAFTSALAHADAVVIPVCARADSVLAGIDVLDELRRSGRSDLAENAVVAHIHDGQYEDEQMLERLRVALEQTGNRLVDIPFDAHAAAGSELSFGRLSPANVQAWTAIASRLLTTPVLTTA
ncbi:ParA family protein [Agromyces sp. Soil535]|uniref:MinD/ParA family ATP-binding protein n=1 Tax=Agromyces sp. Soil535 TaxID=1736390 RepID=UPI0006FB04F4|nr:ParA family protein [Agromyces sp. Soil535]KRE28247.1 hypothetical protein ASG80_21450 [Agromyces sp. Soil535]